MVKDAFHDAMWKGKVWTIYERLAKFGRVQAYEFSVEGTDC